MIKEHRKYSSDFIFLERGNGKMITQIKILIDEYKSVLAATKYFLDMNNDIMYNSFLRGRIVTLEIIINDLDKCLKIATKN